MCLYLFEMKQMPRKNNYSFFSTVVFVHIFQHNAKLNVNRGRSDGLSGKKGVMHLGSAPILPLGIQR